MVDFEARWFVVRWFVDLRCSCLARAYPDLSSPHRRTSSGYSPDPRRLVVDTSELEKEDILAGHP